MPVPRLQRLRGGYFCCAPLFSKRTVPLAFDGAIDGQLVVMYPINASHIVCVNRLSRLFVERTDSEIAVSVHNPVHIDEHNEPEPSVVLSTALNGALHPENVLLLVEVADTTLDYNRNVKPPSTPPPGSRRYGSSIWTPPQIKEVHRKPDEDVYRTCHLVELEDTVAPQRPASIDPLTVRDILGDLPAPEDENT